MRTVRPDGSSGPMPSLFTLPDYRKFNLFKLDDWRLLWWYWGWRYRCCLLEYVQTHAEPGTDMHRMASARLKAHIDGLNRWNRVEIPETHDKIKARLEEEERNRSSLKAPAQE
jgi:hypothetical protein